MSTGTLDLRILYVGSNTLIMRKPGPREILVHDLLFGVEFTCNGDVPRYAAAYRFSHQDNQWEVCYSLQRLDPANPEHRQEFYAWARAQGWTVY